MRKTALIFCMVLLLAFAAAIEYRPDTVKEADLAIVLRASGSYSGEIKTGDSLQVKLLTFQEDERQKILEITETMAIGGDILEPSYAMENGNRYAVFDIDDLEEYGDSAEFEILIDARLKIKSEIGMKQDYSLLTPIEEHETYLLESRYIEVNDYVLQEKAAEFESRSLIDSIMRTAEWVNTNLEYDLEKYYAGTWSARQTYENMAGVCDEFANLTAAFTRINGIPTRYISGISFDGKIFGNHGWLEAYLPGTGWVGLDSTYAEVGYVDAFHIALAKSADANESVSLFATTRSTNKIEVKTTLHEPDVTINDAIFFEGLVDVEIQVPEKVEANEEFEIKAAVKNTQNSNIVIPARLSLHDEFSVADDKEILWLRPLEKKGIIWKATAPNHEDEKTYAVYGALFLTPDNKIEIKINVHAKKKDDGNIENGNIKYPVAAEGDLLFELEKLAEKNIDFIIIGAIVAGILIVAAQFMIRR